MLFCQPLRRGGPPSITLSDTSPGELEVSLSLMMGGDHAEAELNVVFRHEGRHVRFVAGEQLSCNGLAVPGYGTNFHLKAASSVFSGQLMTCIYTSGQASAAFTFTAPLAPAILSPQEQAQVGRSTRTPVSYRLSPDQAYYVIALAPQRKRGHPLLRSNRIQCCWISVPSHLALGSLRSTSCSRSPICEDLTFSRYACLREMQPIGCQ